MKRKAQENPEEGQPKKRRRNENWEASQSRKKALSKARNNRKGNVWFLPNEPKSEEVGDREGQKAKASQPVSSNSDLSKNLQLPLPIPRIDETQPDVVGQIYRQITSTTTPELPDSLIELFSRVRRGEQVIPECFLETPEIVYYARSIFSSQGNPPQPPRYKLEETDISKLVSAGNVNMQLPRQPPQLGSGRQLPPVADRDLSVYEDLLKAVKKESPQVDIGLGGLKGSGNVTSLPSSVPPQLLSDNFFRRPPATGRSSTDQWGETVPEVFLAGRSQGSQLPVPTGSRRFSESSGFRNFPEEQQNVMEKQRTSRQMLQLQQMLLESQQPSNWSQEDLADGSERPEEERKEKKSRGRKKTAQVGAPKYVIHDAGARVGKRGKKDKEKSKKE